MVGRRPERQEPRILHAKAAAVADFEAYLYGAKLPAINEVQRDGRLGASARTRISLHC